VTAPVDITCVQCDYALKGLPTRGKCPECGWPIRRSLGGPLLRHWGVSDLQRLLLGLRVLHRSSIAAGIFLLGIFALFILYGISPNPSRNPMNASLFNATLWIVAAWGTAAMVGAILVSIPARSVTANPIQRFITFALALGPVGAMLWLALTFVPVNASSTKESIHVAGFIAVWAWYFLFDRQLQRIEVRTGPFEQPPRWPFHTRWWAVLMMMTETVFLTPELQPGDSHRSIRRAKYVGPICVMLITVWLRIAYGPSATACLLLILVFPVLLLLTMGGVIRSVKRELGMARSPSGAG